MERSCEGTRGAALIQRSQLISFSLSGRSQCSETLSVLNRYILGSKRSLTPTFTACSSLRFNNVHLLSLALSCAFTLVHQFLSDQHWAFSNIVALSLSFNAVTLLRLDSFFTGASLLGGLFLYDIWFGTSLRVWNDRADLLLRLGGCLGRT